MVHVPEKAVAVAEHRWLRLVCAGFLFLLIFWYPWEPPEHLKPWASRHGDAYLLMPDSQTYVEFNNWTKPWRNIRSIGYPAFLYPFLYPDQQNFMRSLHFVGGAKDFQKWTAPDQPIYAIPRDLGISGKFVAVALAQRFILALAIAVFYLALCRWFGQVFAFVALLAALCLSPPPPPQAIMTEPLSCALTWLCGAFVLYARVSARQGACFAVACLCAGLAFLIRPQTLSLTGLCSLVFLYMVFMERKKHFLAAFARQAVAFSPLLIAYGYIGWLSVTGGQLFLHTLPPVYYLQYYNYAEAEDAQHMPTERAKMFTAWYGQHREAIVGRVRVADNASPPKRAHAVGANIVFILRGGGIWNHFSKVDGIGNLDLLGQSIFGKELLSGLRHRHAGEMLVARWNNFISGFGYYPDVYHLALFPRATFALNMLALAVCLGAMAVSARSRWPLGIMLGIHVMAVLAAALGNTMLQRYVEPTAPFLFLAAFCSCWVLGKSGYVRLAGARQAPPESRPA